MAQTKTTKQERRTWAELATLTDDQVTTALVAAGIRPIEFVSMDDEIFFAYPKPKLEPHERYHWMAYAPIATDPFVASFYERNPVDDLPTQWRGQLFDYELSTYLDGLTRHQLMVQLKTITVEKQRTPEPSWTADQYRTELASRIRELETAVPTTKRRKK